DVFQAFMNAFTMSFDPHTQYFSPRASENFNITMSLSLEGIGAVLQTEDEFTRVISLITAGPAEKSGQLHPNDKIISVGQGTDGEMVDVIGWRVDEVVELIRGKKGTVVRLGVLPASAGDSGDSRYVTLVRNKVKIEEQSAKSEIVEIEQFGFKHKIGVIDIPTFYIDWKALQEGDPNYKSTHRDVARLLTELKQEGVEGIIIDLRNNGGGSLQEAQFLTGLFIDRGPTVQIRHKNNGLDILPDRDFRVAYEGPLAVMVNRLSASASEIFAGAIQDYQRGVIIGTQTFGKGTVQTLITLNRGQLKITQSKFYRISGESTQHQGVIPDIAYPEQYDPETIGESTLDDPLPWDKIQAVGYKTQTNLVELLPELVSRHKIRAEYNPDFEYMRKAITIQREQAKIKTLSLSESKRIERRQILDGRLLALENEKRQAKGLPTIASLKELDEPDEEEEIAAVGITTGESDNPDTGEGQDSENLVGNEMAGNLQTTERNAADADPQGVPNDKIHKKAPDELLIESGNILLDWVSMKQRTASKDGQADLRAL
ncbi:MAG: carboxy terminal-processing peptidase, partial [Gammaproteobacteria bacterium]|nr:carboxy terminal-processing peptidase [Gammaproteobacteria bacterium]